MPSLRTDFNPRSPRGGATIDALGAISNETISIHAPHEGERRVIRQRKTILYHFNPRSPRGGATRRRCCPSGAWAFQSTLPTRGSDACRDCVHARPIEFQSTLPTRGSDAEKLFRWLRLNQYFNPRSPRGGATPEKSSKSSRIMISIHAPHEGERPIVLKICVQQMPYFNPRSPRGGATGKCWCIAVIMVFQSTLPTRGSDAPHNQVIQAVKISIHAPHEGERPLRDG